MANALSAPEPGTAQERNRQADQRDAAAESRDEAADDRDVRADAQDDAHGRPGKTRSVDRTGSSLDRDSSAEDREEAAADREAAAEDLARAERQIDRLMHDALTGFYERDAGVMELEREVVRSHRTGEPFTVAFVDVDGLKTTNDTQGHEAGDRVIVEVAQEVQSVLREYDVVIRYGGDEFVCGMQGLSEADAAARFAVLREHLQRNSGRSASVGVAQLEPDESLQALISRADAAMYEDKLAKGTPR